MEISVFCKIWNVAKKLLWIVPIKLAIIKRIKQGLIVKLTVCELRSAACAIDLAVHASGRHGLWGCL